MYGPGTEGEGNEISVSTLQKIVLVLTILLALALGIFPDMIIRLI